MQFNKQRSKEYHSTKAVEKYEEEDFVLREAQSKKSAESIKKVRNEGATGTATFALAGTSTATATATATFGLEATGTATATATFGSAATATATATAPKAKLSATASKQKREEDMPRKLSPYKMRVLKRRRKVKNKMKEIFKHYNKEFSSEEEEYEDDDVLPVSQDYGAVSLEEDAEKDDSSDTDGSDDEKKKVVVCDHTKLKSEDHGGYCRSGYYLEDVHCVECGILFTEDGENGSYKVGRKRPVMTCYNCDKGCKYALCTKCYDIKIVSNKRNTRNRKNA